MEKTIVIFGSTTGMCEAIAEKIASQLGAEAMNVSDMTAQTLAQYDNLILGTSTWGSGELQDDWYDGVDTLKAASLGGKVVALFGCGDAVGYGDTFCGAMAELYQASKEAGATLVGAVDAASYSFEASDAVIDGKFVGLALDDVNEEEKTDARIENWIADIRQALI